MSKNINKIQISSSEDDKLQFGGNWVAKKLWRLERLIFKRYSAVSSRVKDIINYISNVEDRVNLLNDEQIQSIESLQKECVSKTEVAQDLAAKQDALSDSADITVSANNELSLTEKAKYALFDAQWTAAGGTVITPGKVYECNGTDDLTFAEAVDIMARYSKRKPTDLTRVFFSAKCRALLPIWSNGVIKLNSAFQSSYIRKIVFKTHQTPSVVGIASGGSGAAFHTCGSLREIDGILDFTAEHDPLTFTFRWCDELREVRIKGLNSNALLTESSHLSLASLQYLVANATNTKTITVTVHPDVYAKLSGDSTNAAVAALTAEELTQWQQVLADAIAKNISIATV